MVIMPIGASKHQPLSAQTSLHLDDTIVNENGRSPHSNQDRHRGKAKLLITRLCNALTKRIDFQRSLKGGRDKELIKQEYVVEDDGDPKSLTWCDVTIPNSISISPEMPLKGTSTRPLNPVRPSDQILDRSDYLTILSRFSNNDRAAILRRAAKQFSNASVKGTLRSKAPSVATKQYYTFYHVQVAVEFCQYQPETDFFPAPNAYNLEYGIQCLNKCLTLDRFLLYCDATRIEYERQLGISDASRHSEGSKAPVIGDDIVKTIQRLERYRRHLDR